MIDWNEYWTKLYAGADAQDMPDVFLMHSNHIFMFAAKGALLDCGALGALMTGTGSAVFGVFREKEKAEAARAALAKEYRFCRTVEAVGPLL